MRWRYVMYCFTLIMLSECFLGDGVSCKASADFEIIWTKNLFSRQRCIERIATEENGGADSQKIPDDGAGNLRERIRVCGIIYSERSRLVLLKFSGKNGEKLVREGEMIGAWTLLRVKARSAVFRGPTGNIVEYMLPGDDYKAKNIAISTHRERSETERN